MNFNQIQGVSTGAVEVMENRFASRFAGRLAGRVQGTDQTSAAQIVSWMDLVDLCRELDDSLVLKENPSPDSLSLHEAVLSLAIGCGSWLIHQLRVNGVDISASGQTLETLDASLELLRILYRSRHSGLAEAEVESVRRRIFNAAA